MSDCCDKYGCRLDRQLCDRKFQDFRWKYFLFESRIRTVRHYRPDGCTSAANNFQIRLRVSGPRGMAVRTVDLQRARKSFKLISLALKILETPGLSRLNSSWHKKIDHKVIWSRFLLVESHAIFLHRTIVIRIFVSRKGFKLISLALKIFKMPGLSRLNSVWPKKTDHKVVWSRFLPIWTHARFLHRAIVIQILCPGKVSNSFLSHIKYSKRLGCPD
jgi:hypothetical protein